MSWHFEGRTYHNFSEYLTAIAAASRRHAATGVEEVRSENRRISEAIQRDRKQLDSLRGDVKAQMEATERIRSNVRSVERNQQRMNQMLQETERRMQSGFAEIEREFQGQHAAIHGVEANVADLRAQQQQHVEQVRQDFLTAQAEVAQQMEQARRQQRESEERLQGEIREVDLKVEHDRAERARRAKDQLALIDTEITEAAAALARVQEKVEGLSLGGDLHQVENRLRVARTLLAQQDTSAALSTTMLAHADATSLEREATRREIELTAFQKEVERRAHWIETTLGPEATEAMQECFRLEIEEVLQELAASKERSWSPGMSYSSFAHMRDLTNEALSKLEARTLEIVSSAPLVAEAAIERVEKVEAQIAAMEKIYGRLTEMQNSYARPLDIKSDLLMQLRFGSSRVELRAGLDARMSIDGFNYGSAAACATAAGQMMESLSNGFVVSQQQVDSHDRTQPLPPREDSLGSAKRATKEFAR
jgi:chromosome segregation ATPase